MLPALTTAATFWHDGYWHHGGPPFFWVIPLFWLLLLAGVAWLLVSRRDRWGSRSAQARLAERYAAGDIDEDEYRTRREVLRGSR
ncbi:MAG: SHOCT domain-containing protein [Marmoricola sp.]